MLGLILLYWLGKYFYKLAGEYDKSKWGYAILGIGVYIVATIATVILLLLFDEIFELNFLNSLNDRIVDLICMPFGLASVYFLYKYLQKNWEKNKPKVDSLIDQIGKLE